MNTYDYYQVLNVDPTAEQREIKISYRQLARQLHPDLNADPLAEERFKEINAAYEILCNPGKRLEYDRVYWQQPDPAEANGLHSGSLWRHDGQPATEGEAADTATVLRLFVKTQLKAGVVTETIIRQVMERSTLNRLEATGFVQYVEATLRYQRTKWRKVANVSMYSFGLLTGLAMNFFLNTILADFYRQNQGLANINIGLSTILMVGSLIGLAWVLKTT